MIGALWILIFTVVIGLILYIGEVHWRRKNKNNSVSEPLSEPTNDTSESEACCGLHLVCEKDSLSPMSAEIIYYDDEELDRFVGRQPDSYSPEETEEFREVLMTLLPEDLAGWARSVTQRRLQLPAEIHDELLLLIRDLRENSSTQHSAQ